MNWNLEIQESLKEKLYNYIDNKKYETKNIISHPVKSSSFCVLDMIDNIHALRAKMENPYLSLNAANEDVFDTRIKN